MLDVIFQSSAQQVLAKYKTEITKINDLETTFRSLSDLKLKEKVTELKQRFLNDENDEFLVLEGFALVREASKRVLGLRHFDVQLIGGLVLNEGKIAEMKTGEGKTLVAVLPIFLKALHGKGAHVITVNDYLARRDADYIGQVYTFLGLSVGLIQESMNLTERKRNYNCDIVYLTNTQLGFDYLRDNLALSSDEIVQRSFYYCVIDEVDSILIDEARTPLIISGAGKTYTKKYLQTAKLATVIERDIHYKVDEKNQNVILNNEGISFCEKALGITNIYNPMEPWIFYVLNSIKAKELFKLNKNYIINENKEIIIVDEFTGRTMVGRRWGDGLHQAIEAKENLVIQDENQTVASISYQNLFLLYQTLSGMTGTAKTEEAEFEKIYNLKVVTIPTNNNLQRKDLSDLIYKTQYLKWRSIAQECLEMYNIGRPVLIGTTTIEKSELLAALLEQYKVPYRLLNARPENVESESEIIAQAGCKKAVTIATNMAGRGTDILLGGNPTFLTTNLIKEIFQTEKSIKNKSSFTYLNGSNDDLIESLKPYYLTLLEKPLYDLEQQKDPTTIEFLNLYNSVYKEQKLLVTRDNKEIIKLGGLHVIGTERHESRRIDNQLRGRAGRQGDPGSSRFFLCLEDKLLRIFGGEKILNIMQTIGFQDDAPIRSRLLDNSLESAQKKVEALNFDTRKQLFEYDQAINLQRNKVYLERKTIFEQNNVRNLIIQYAEQSCKDLFNYFNNIPSAQMKNLILLKLQTLLGASFPTTFFDNNNKIQSLKFFQQQVEITYELKEIEMEIIGDGVLREIEKTNILEQIDISWAEHLQRISLLKDSVKWRALGQKNPLTEYKKEAYNYYTRMLAKIRHRVVYLTLRAKILIF
jgi:preprotein translocase subunit SecA|tara:strand:+ start:33964 stop:36567 length:2604 start_codon:yes stop_codon:yes gene_type:complete